MSLQLSDFESLVSAIADVNQRLHHRAVKAVNTALTLRNWLIGCYVDQYELGGRDRAAYGEHLIESLAVRLRECRVPRADARELRRHRQFFLAYPQIQETLTPELTAALPRLPPAEQIRETASPESVLAGADLLLNLSFSHFAELLNIRDPTQRAFYEIQCIRGLWSVRELRRQIASLLYERTGLSRDKAATVALAHGDVELAAPAQVVRDPYVFEFLGLKPAEVVSESDLEHALLDRLQAFLLELGRGFCFEARQKRILIGGEHFFVDMVFYHRLLKCHVLIELKVDSFSHEHLGQLNTYVTWFGSHEKTAGDNPPVGILLCTDKNHALVEYALAGMDNQLFVSKYQLVLPDKDEMRRFIEAQMAEGLDP
jgi:predicted nuclease of restriction endonuclease-like (RecB) superfamily